MITNLWMILSLRVLSFAPVVYTVYNFSYKKTDRIYRSRDRAICRQLPTYVQYKDLWFYFYSVFPKSQAIIPSFLFFYILNKFLFLSFQY